jgi:hypothetical protein
VGGLLTNSFSADDDAIGLVYALTSYGDDAGSATVGVGWGFSGEDFSDKPGMVVGFDLEAGGSIRFVSENWIPSDFDAAIISIGIRFVGDPVTADLALVYPSGSDSDGFPFIPWLGFAFAF